MYKSCPLFAVLLLASCASDVPSVWVTHTHPPQYSIVPAKVVAVTGPANDHFVGYVAAELRKRAFQVVDEQATAMADVIVRVQPPECSDDEDEDEGTWQAECPAAAADLIDARSGEKIASVKADGQGSSGSRNTAWNDAIDDAVEQLIDGFTPCRQGERVSLDKTAPLAAAGITLIDGGHLRDARSLWETGLSEHPASAPLLYNLGAVCEALADLDAAHAYYVRAAELAPDVPLYQEGLSNLEERIRDEETAKKSQQTLDAEAAAKVAARKSALEEAEREKREAAQERAANIRKTALNTPAGISFLLIPAGTFTMGCTDGDAACLKNEEPPHAVTISKPFYLAFTPTTNYQYKQCIDAGACGGAADMTRRLDPVVNVSWKNAQDFCAWAGGRLPTEAEWEYAARGGTEGWRFPWGNEAGNGNANFADNHGRGSEYIGLLDDERTPAAQFKLGLTYPYGGTSPVATFEKNGFGLYDMAGNAAQWTADWKGPDIEAGDAHITAGWEGGYADADVTDPVGPATGERRIVRGGSWTATSYGVRVSVRYALAPDEARPMVGFRCAR